MTLEELKAEANKLGYSLIKNKPYIPIKPCPVCGRKVLICGMMQQIRKRRESVPSVTLKEIGQTEKSL